MTTKHNSTRTRLVASALAMLLCVAMLVGTTFAWFSDEAKTGETTITAGNLDVAIQTPKGESLDGVDIFDTVLPDLWEPGAMAESIEFEIVNKGTLALQYRLNIKVEDANPEDGIDLTQVIKMKVVENGVELGVSRPHNPDATLEDRQNYWDAITGASESSIGTLAPNGTSGKLTAILYWEPTQSTDLGNPDNEYNKPRENLQATFSVDVFATQVSSESDSFGSGYDDLTLTTPPASNGDAGLHFNDLKEGTTVYSEDTSNAGPTAFSGSGTVDLNKDVTVESTDDYYSYTFVVKGEPENRANVTFTGEGSVKKPPEDGSWWTHAIMVLSNADVTIAGGSYEGIGHFGDDSTVTVKGGTVTGVVRIYETRTPKDAEEKVIIIEDGAAVEGALFLSGDESHITIPEGYEWQEGGEYEVPAPEGQTYVQLVPTPAA